MEVEVPHFKCDVCGEVLPETSTPAEPIHEQRSDGHKCGGTLKRELTPDERRRRHQQLIINTIVLDDDD